LHYTHLEHLEGRVSQSPCSNLEQFNKFEIPLC
jgi:hypothetical protein